MIDRINSILDMFDVGDIKFLYLVAKKNLKNLLLVSLIVSLLVLLISLNQQKKYLSKAIIVIEPQDNKIVNIEEAYSGDIIGLHNHGTIQVGDTFSEGEVLKYSGIPYFAPELFRRVVLKDPLRGKALKKGLVQLTEEGATQLFKPLKNNDLILGAVGVLQFDVTAFRLKAEYNVECVYDNVSINTARWVSSDNTEKFAEFKKKTFDNLAEDGGGYLVYLASSRVNLQLTEERWPDIQFSATREL